jgi:hypothetical protein
VSHVGASSTAGTQTAAGGQAGASTDAVAQADASKDAVAHAAAGAQDGALERGRDDAGSRHDSSRDHRSDALEQRRSGAGHQEDLCGSAPRGAAAPRGASVACGRRRRAAGRDTDGTTQYACDDAGSRSRDDCSDAFEHQSAGQICELLAGYSCTGPTWTFDRCVEENPSVGSADDRNSRSARRGASVALRRRPWAAGRDTDGTTQYACDDAGSRHLCSSRDDCSDALEHQAAGRDDDGTTRHYA